MSLRRFDDADDDVNDDVDDDNANVKMWITPMLALVVLR